MVSIKQQIHTYQSLDNWFYSPQGLWATQAFRDALSPFMSFLTGECFLQIGACGTNSWLNEMHFTHKWIASPYTSNQPNHIITSLTQLPLERESVDCILAPLILESFHDGVSILDEIDRILKPMGYLIILGINPISMWGIGSKFGLLTGLEYKKGRLRSSFSLNRACMARGFEQMMLTNFGYIPPVQSKACVNRFFFMDEIGKMLWPFPANLYCYIAQKYEPGYALQPYFAQAQFGVFGA